MGEYSFFETDLPLPSTPVKATLPTPHPTPSFWQLSHPTPLSSHRSTPTLPTTADIVIIGSGISAAFACQELVNNLQSHASKPGTTNPFRIVVLEARTLASGATGRNGGHCQPQVYGPDCHGEDRRERVRFEMQNFRVVEGTCSEEGLLSGEREEGEGSCEWQAKQGVHVFYDTGLFEEAKGQIRALRGVDEELGGLVRVVEGGDEAGMAELGVRRDGSLEEMGARSAGGKAVGAVVQEVAASLSPYKLVVGLWRRLIGNVDVMNVGKVVSYVDLNVQTSTPVTSLTRSETDAGVVRPLWQVTTDRGTISASQVLLCTNGYTSHLLPCMADLIVPVQGQMSALVPPSAGSSASHPSIPRSKDEEVEQAMLRLKYTYAMIGSPGVHDDYLVQRPVPSSSSRSINSALDGELMFGGGRALSLHAGVSVSDDGYVDKRCARYLREALPEMLKTNPPDPHRRQRQRQGQAQRRELTAKADWTGIMGFSRDGVPWVGSAAAFASEEETLDGLWVCAGYTGHGMPNAALCGRYIARLICAAMQGEDWREEEMKAMNKGLIPEAFTIEKARIERARRMPEVLAES